MRLLTILKDWSNLRFFNRVIAMEKKEDVKRLIRALRHEYSPAKCRAADALGWIGDGSAVEPLMLLLRDTDDDARACAAFALGKISHDRKSDARPVGCLVYALKDAVAEVRFNAARSLGWIGDPGAVKALISALDDPGEVGYTTVAEEAAEALLKIAKKSPIKGPTLRRAKKLVDKRPEREKQREQQSDREMLAEDPHLCDRAIRLMLEFKYYGTVPGGMPRHKVDQYLPELVMCIEVLCEIALAKIREGIIVPSEAQVIRAIYDANIIYVESAMAAESALKKLGAL